MHEPKGSISPTGRAAAIHRRPGAFRPPDPVGAGQPDDRLSARWPARGRGTRLAAVLGLPVHEGVRPGRCARIRRLRRSLLEFPWPRLYEHPWMNCALAIERTYRGEEGVFVGLFRAPEQQTLGQLQEARGLVQERDAGEGRLLPHGAAVQPGADADPAAALVEHAEHLGLQALQAVRHVRPVELRLARAPSSCIRSRR